MTPTKNDQREEKQKEESDVRNIWFEFDNETPKVGDKIIKVFFENKGSPLGEVTTIIEDNWQTTSHMKCSNGMGYNKYAEHGWRRLIGVGYDKPSQSLTPTNPSGDVYRWVKCSENKFPKEKGDYYLRHPYEDGRWHNWCYYINPDAIDKEYWVRMEYEWLEKITRNTEGEYWKKRCELAEQLLAGSMNPDFDKTYKEWQQLKSQPPEPETKENHRG